MQHMICNLKYLTLQSNEFSPESIALSLCNSNVYNNAESVVENGTNVQFHFHDEDGSSNHNRSLR